jgi:diguanylate cyclase (GGDEF)-like protein
MMLDDAAVSQTRPIVDSTGAGRPSAARGRRERPRPVLLLLVFSAFLLIVGLTATGQAFLVTADSSATLTSSTVGSDAATVRSFVTLNLRPSDLGASLSSDRQALLDRGLALLVDEGGILQAAVMRVDGRVLAASDGPSVGTIAPMTEDFGNAVSDRFVHASMVAARASGAVGPIAVDGVIAEYFPIISEGQVFAVAGVWRDAAPILVALDQARQHVVIAALAAAIISLVLLYFVFRAAQARLSRQTLELLEATRLDALTGSLNHGALVEAVTTRIDVARDQGSGGVSVALIDLDNLTLLNNTYGHSAGDEALLAMAALLAERFGERAVWGRYGPDEFLVAVAGESVASFETDLEGMRVALADRSLTFDSSERLPITISVGVATYPSDGQSVTTLLATASVTLDEAKASGGDAIHVADAARPVDADAGRFDMLEGLVLAIDTKDRYTRRHSEDVARYADFLATTLGIDGATRRTIYRAGRLHDVGKIGIPDSILRKPAMLTADEYAVVKQHVALGDLIVRDLPDDELVRAGVRHHHERWDGQGYLHGLAGEEIPLIARILAVADAFSAMTTTRPYRKALSVDEALRRLEDASGTQLDARLVLQFVGGIRTAANPPLPGNAVGGLWTPRSDVA